MRCASVRSVCTRYGLGPAGLCRPGKQPARSRPPHQDADARALMGGVQRRCAALSAAIPTAAGSAQSTAPTALPGPHLGHGIHTHPRPVDLDLVSVHGCGGRAISRADVMPRRAAAGSADAPAGLAGQQAISSHAGHAARLTWCTDDTNQQCLTIASHYNTRKQVPANPSRMP